MKSVLNFKRGIRMTETIPKYLTLCGFTVSYERYTRFLRANDGKSHPVIEGIFIHLLVNTEVYFHNNSPKR